jgi:hypothetical protein
MPVLDLFFTILYITLLFMWFWLVITIFADIFRSDMGGWAKAGWSIFVVFLPFLGVLIYLIVNGDKMRQRDVDQAKAVDKAQREYIQSVAGSSGGTADELAKLAQLRDQGVISDDEFQAQKTKLLA